MRRFSPLLWLSVLFLLAFLLPITVRSASPDAQKSVLIDHAGDAYNGIEVTLAADRAPAAGEVVTLTLTARPLRDAPEVFVEWELPDGGELLDGPAREILGSVAAGEQIHITRRARFSTDGVFSVRARAYYFPNDATSLAATGVLFFTTRPGAPTASDLDPRTPIYEPPAAKRTVDKSHLAGMTGRAADGCFTVKGILSRENRMPAAVVVPEGPPPPAVPRYTGQYQNQLGSAVPVHHILVEMREEDTVSDDSYGHTVTDANGNFRFNFCDDDGFLDDELELYFRVCAEVRSESNLIARIEHTDDRELYCWDSNIIESEGGNVDFDLSVYRLNQTQAAVFNIADALYWAWRFWNNNNLNSPVMDRSVTVYWQGGKGATGSFYSDSQTAMVIADDPSSTDEWDDSVIIHEWGHFADHQFSCNQNPGGAHSLPGVNAGLNGNQLAWGEGYPDYYQSVARTIMPGSASAPFYVDPSGPTVDLENMRGVTASNLDEGAIAALLWDFHDTVNDNQDTVSHGHTAIQRVFADGDFRGNAQCDLNRFLQVWRKLSLPTDAATAATIVQNVNINLGSLPPIAAVVANQAADTPAEPAAPAAAPPLEFRWWDQVTMVIDNSSSMAGPPAAPKINTVKTIIAEQVNDLAPRPGGTEFNIYTFNSVNGRINPLVEGRFFANQILPPVNNLTANGPDSGCPSPGLGALSQAIQNKYDGDAWLYTDGDSAGLNSPEQMRLELNQRRVRASIVLLGGCGSIARKQSDVTGAERTYLGLAADSSQPSGLVPYLLTSMMSGGQFIYVAPDQLANAVDMVRAQLSHTAGAGRWSDYVSNQYTYRWDRLESWEYQWFPADLSQLAGQLPTNTALRVTLPLEVSFYGDKTKTVDVYEDGYIRMNPCLLANPQFCPSLNFQFMNLLYTDLRWYFITPGPNDPSPAGVQAPDESGNQVWVYTANLGNEWVILTTEGTANYAPPGSPGDFALRRYQAWINAKTGEIRFQYDRLRNEAASAEIGLEAGIIFAGGNVLVSKNDVSGAANGMGYKFTPAPPQPSKVYEVDVDPLIEGVIFLQTGYSGDFAPMAVQYPDGSSVNCNDTANVRCLTVNNKPGDRMVQFIQVNTKGRPGLYKATIAVGPSGGGTFSFNALAASDLRASSPGKHTISLKSPYGFLVDLGRATDDGQLKGWLQTPAGLPFGNSFTLYDDGAHNDGEPNDGRFGANPFALPRAGAAYLWVEGTIGGVKFKRSDPVPFNFQPLHLWKSLDKEGYYGDNITVTFWAENLRPVRHCYAIEFTKPDDWTLSSPEAPSICIPANTTTPIFASVSKPLSSGALGEIGEIGLTMTEIDEGAITASATARVTMFRRPASLEFDNRQIGPVRPNGTDKVELTLNLIDDLGQVVGYSGPFNGELTVTGGTITMPTGTYDNGRLTVIFTAGTSPGIATISALAEGGLTAETTITLAVPAAEKILLTATPTNLSQAAQSALVATVLDQFGNPVSGAKVRLSVGDDNGDKGTIGGGEVLDGTTNSNGRLNATFVKKPDAQGQVVVRAELLDNSGNAARETALVLYLSDPPGNLQVFLPVAIR
ncbi:MAG: hypothetical protein R6X18_01610 [Chloroflexota bacterium]|jgi:hypothetical protein